MNQATALSTNDTTAQPSAAPHDREPNDGRVTVDALGERLPLTLSVERAAKIVGIGRTAMYTAVRRGDFRTIRLNGRLAVLTLPLLRRIGINTKPSQ